MTKNLIPVSVKKKRLQYLRNKTFFSNLGVILERNKETGMIQICHIPYCGMDNKTAKRLGDWLIKRSQDK